MKRVLLLLVPVLLLAGCSGGKEAASKEEGFTQISPEEAAEMMRKNDGHIIVDVRRQDEYDAGHIPGAVCVPNESIGTEMPEELPDLNQIILVYCRTGNRSKQASRKLAEIGYANVYEFGGIQDWPGEIVPSAADEIWTASEMPVKLRYDRMWEYSGYAETEDPELIAAVVAAVKALKPGEAAEYSVEDYTDLLTFGFADGNTITLCFEEQLWVKNGNERYITEGLSALRSLLDQMISGE